MRSMRGAAERGDDAAGNASTDVVVDEYDGWIGAASDWLCGDATADARLVSRKFMFAAYDQLADPSVFRQVLQALPSQFSLPLSKFTFVLSRLFMIMFRKLLLFEQPIPMQRIKSK